MSEKKPVYVTAAHWSETETARKAFVQTVADLGLDGSSVPSILGVECVREFDGTVDEAIDILIDYTAQHRLDVRDALNPQDAHHGEAFAIAFADVFLEDGSPIHITARQGASPDDVVATTLALVDALATLRKFGIRTTRVVRSTPTARVETPDKSVIGPTEFWTAARRYIGPGGPFENKGGVARWLSQFATGKGYNWADAIKALHGLNASSESQKQNADEFGGIGLLPLNNF